MAESFVRTAVGYEFPTADWLDPFDADEGGTQWFFVNQNRISRAWIAPAGEDHRWGLAENEPLLETFINPRSCLYCLEKSAVVSGGQVVREWSPTVHKYRAAPESCDQHNGLYFVLTQGQQEFVIHEGAKYATYDEALAEALSRRQPGHRTHRTMVARMVKAQSMW